MSANEADRARRLAERIASRLAKERRPEHADAPSVARGDSTTTANIGDELAALRASVSEIGQRLRQIESHVATNNMPRSTASADRGDMPGQQPSKIRSPQNDPAPSSHGGGNPQRWLSSTYVPAAVHPSEERFGIDEAVSELVEFFEREKVCNVEPGGKPCDHCGMCSSRGF